MQKNRTLAMDILRREARKTRLWRTAFIVAFAVIIVDRITTVNASFYIFQISIFSVILNLVHDKSCTFVYNYFQILERK